MANLFENKNISPMLLYESEPFDDENYIFELKLDGIRCLAYIDKSKVILHNKRYKDVSVIYPELMKMNKCINKKCILDGEVICLTNGKPNFYEVQKRSLMTDAFKIKLSAKKNPVQFVAYDILFLDKEDVTQLPLIIRKKLLEENVKEGNNLSLSRFVEKEGQAFFSLVKEQELEGIVAKEKSSKYLIGKRSKNWLKIKVMQDEDLIVCGYQPSENGDVKDLVLAYYDEKGNLKCRGKVYLGVSKGDQQKIKQFAKNNSIANAWFPKYKNVVWLKLELVGTAHFMHATKTGGMRQPVWKGLRDDKNIKDCIIKKEN